MILAAGQGAILLAPTHSSSAAAHLILLFRNGRQAKLQGFIVFLSKQFEPCQLVSCLMRIERRTFAAPSPTSSNRPLRPRSRRYAKSGGWLVNDQILDLIANFPALLNHRFCKPKVGSSILSTGTNEINYLIGNLKAALERFWLWGKHRGRIPEVRFWQPQRQSSALKPRCGLDRDTERHGPRGAVLRLRDDNARDAKHTVRSGRRRLVLPRHVPVGDDDRGDATLTRARRGPRLAIGDLSRCPGQPRAAVLGHRPVAHVRHQRGTEQEHRESQRNRIPPHACRLPFFFFCLPVGGIFPRHRSRAKVVREHDRDDQIAGASSA